MAKRKRKLDPAEYKPDPKRKPKVTDFFTKKDLANAAPYYFVLRNYILQLKAERDAQGLTLADVAEKSGLAVESLCRLEKGSIANPTWKTLGVYARAIGCRPVLMLDNECKKVPAHDGNGVSVITNVAPQPLSFAEMAFRAIPSRQCEFIRAE